MKSIALKTGQNLILQLKINYILKLFQGVMQKLYCLSKFADWKKTYNNDFALKGYLNRFDLYSQLITKEKISKIYYLEFGVSRGESMKWWLQQIQDKDSRFFGFDTFEGIPEDWGTKPKGSYTNHGNIPLMNDARCEFIKGLFQETLVDFLSKHQLKERLVIHLDADLYSATLFCLFALGSHLKTGDILIFDEFDITTHEFRALLDFQNAYRIDFELIGESNNYNKITLKIK